MNVPLTGAADHALAGLATKPLPEAATLLGARAALRRFRIPGTVSANGACRLLPAQDDWIALNLPRADDRASLPALFKNEWLDPDDDHAISAELRRHTVADLVARGRLLGLAIAGLHERHALPTHPCVKLLQGSITDMRRTHPRVLDLSSLWAGPLAAHLLHRAGAEVTKAESTQRPDAMRYGQPDFFAQLNDGKTQISLDFNDTASLHRLIAQADIVIEAARPRALAQFGIDANHVVATRPGLVWITITGHGATGEAANWVGFGDDCGIAGGLGAAMLAATGRPGFVGDAIADPLTGIFAAQAAWRAWQNGEGGRWGTALSDVTAYCLAWEQHHDPDRLQSSLRAWADAEGQAFRPC